MSMIVVTCGKQTYTTSKLISLPMACNRARDEFGIKPSHWIAIKRLDATSIMLRQETGEEFIARVVEVTS
jgi:hypothetical protein